MKRSRRYRSAASLLDARVTYGVDEAVQKLKELSLIHISEPHET